MIYWSHDRGDLYNQLTSSSGIAPAATSRLHDFNSNDSKAIPAACEEAVYSKWVEAI